MKRIEPPTCPYCGQPAQLVDSAIVYGGRSYGLIWDCRPCDAYVGTHKNSLNHAPLGRLANRELREWKRKAHDAFDPIWQSGQMKRQEAYWWLCEQMGLGSGQAHIGKFDVSQCQWVVRLCQQREREAA